MQMQKINDIILSTTSAMTHTGVPGGKGNKIG